MMHAAGHMSGVHGRFDENEHSPAGFGRTTATLARTQTECAAGNAKFRKRRSESVDAGTKYVNRMPKIKAKFFNRMTQKGAHVCDRAARGTEEEAEMAIPVTDASFGMTEMMMRYDKLSGEAVLGRALLFFKVIFWHQWSWFFGRADGNQTQSGTRAQHELPS